MFPVYPLISGINGAENGRAELYRRGTSTRLHYYTEYDGGSSLVAANNDVDLDGNGRAVVYVDQEADVKVYDYAGEQLAPTFAVGGRADAIEVVSPAFTGTDPEDASTATNKPVSLDDVMDLWVTSNKGPQSTDTVSDWQVWFEGEAQDIADALGALWYLVYNVKDPEYGAAGDGTTDDTAAVQATIDACYDSGNGGGVVFFPPGTYKITDQLDVKAGVALRGAGALKSILSSSYASGTAFVFDSNAAPLEHSGLKFTQSGTAVAQTLVDDTGGTTFYGSFRGCTFDGANVNATLVSVTPSNSVTFENCSFNTSHQQTMLEVAGATSVFSARACTFTVAAIAYTATVVSLTGAGTRVMDACTLDGSSITSGTYTMVSLVGSAAVSGCTFNGGSGTSTAIDGLQAVGAEGGNSFNSITNRYAAAPAGGAFIAGVDENVDMATRRGACERILASDATANKTDTADALAYECFVYRVTGATTDLTITIADAYLGCVVDFVIYNASAGGPMDVVFDSISANELVTEDADATYTIALGKMRAFRFRRLLIADNVEAWVAFVETGDMDSL